MIICKFISCKNESEVMKTLIDASFGKSHQDLSELNLRAAEQLMKLGVESQAKELYKIAMNLKCVPEEKSK